MTDASCFIGIDVGTGSARAGVFDASGRMLAGASHDIRLWKPQPEFVEQSSTDIWNAVCRCVREAMRTAGRAPGEIGGIGFDATCSLVAIDAHDAPVTVSPTGENEQNIVVWMDHRAIRQADRINAGTHDVLQYVGGVISPEMQTPKLLWLKENLPDTWRRAAHFFDLPDWLTYRATGDTTRSLCTTVCKWTYLGHENEGAGRWDEDYWRAIGLEDIVDDDFARIGAKIRPMGQALGAGLTPRAATELGLAPGTPVGVSIIDAHAGGIGMIGAGSDNVQSLDSRLALIGGTSSCHMAVSPEARRIQGVWGPYYSAMVPGMWLTEGGQSATGALVDHVIFSHARSTDLRRMATESRRTVYDVLNDRLDTLAANDAFPAALTREFHMLPYFHGNRSPRADPTLRGMISGLALGDTLDDLAVHYLSAIQAIAYGTRHIIETMNEAGYAIDTIVACGGGTKNPVFLREHADITGCRIALPRERETVLLGSAILGATAGGAYPSIEEAMAAMSGIDRVIEPAGGEVTAYHDKKYSVFHKMYDDFTAYRGMMR